MITHKSCMVCKRAVDNEGGCKDEYEIVKLDARAETRSALDLVRLLSTPASVR